MKHSWRKVSLGQIAPARSAAMPAHNCDVWNLSLEDIEGGTGTVKKKVFSRVSNLGSTKCSFDTRHVLYSKLRPYLNKVVVPNDSGVGTSELIPLHPDPERLDREFLAYYLRSGAFLEFANANTRGANLPRISMTEFWSHEIPVPESISEQARIVAQINECMERVSEIERLQAQARREAACLENAALHDAISEGIGRGGWPLRILGDVANSFRYGTSGKAHAEEVGVPVLRMGNIVNGYLDFSDLKFIDLDDRELKKYRLDFGNILINRTNSLELVGKAAMFDKTDGDWVYASYLVCVDVDQSRVIPEFVAGVLNSQIGRDYVLATARRAIGMVNINAKEMARFPMPLPPIKEQAAIVERLRSVRAVAEALRDELASLKIEQLRSAVLRKAFTGKL
jgi:type I restriction enzyme S subunit